MADFSVMLLTAAPPGHGAEAGGPFVKIDGRESLLRCAELFLNRPNVKQIQIVFESDAIEQAKKKYGVHLGFTGVKVVSGGPRWIDQLVAAGATIDDETAHVLVHDAARPAVSYLDIEAIMEVAPKHAVASLATPLRSPVVEVDEGGGAMAYHPPQKFMHLVTPQVFSTEKFKELVTKKEEFHISQITLVKGSPLNVRCGGGGDSSLVKAMLHMLPKPKVKPPSSPFEEAQW
jgi:2-C-methyl-D-erythritol 4-phosphate cytidylyltransferase